MKRKINKWVNQEETELAVMDLLLLTDATIQPKLLQETSFGPKRYFLKKLEVTLNSNQVSR